MAHLEVLPATHERLRRMKEERNRRTGNPCAVTGYDQMINSGLDAYDALLEVQ